MTKFVSIPVITVSILFIATALYADVSFVGQDNVTGGAWRTGNGGNPVYGNDGYIDIARDIADWASNSWLNSRNLAYDVVSLPGYISDYMPTYEYTETDVDPSETNEGYVEGNNGGDVSFAAEDVRMPGVFPNDYGCAINHDWGLGNGIVSFDLLPSALSAGQSFHMSLYLASGDWGPWEGLYDITIDDGSGAVTTSGITGGHSPSGFDNWVTFRIYNWDGVSPVNVRILGTGFTPANEPSFGSSATVTLDIIAFDPYVAPIPPVDCDEVFEKGYGFAGDINKDCYVNLLDFALAAQQWLTCNNPEDPTCQ